MPSDNGLERILLSCGRMARTETGTMGEQDILRRRLAELETEHRDLDDVIARISETPIYDQLQVQRLKKRKLRLKDEIARIRALLVPDIIA